MEVSEMDKNSPDYEFDFFEHNYELDNVELIITLLNYSKSLEEQIVELRKEVNDLTLDRESLPYLDLHSDIYETFDDHPAYERHRDYIGLFFQY